MTRFTHCTSRPRNLARLAAIVTTAALGAALALSGCSPAVTEMSVMAPQHRAAKTVAAGARLEGFPSVDTAAQLTHLSDATDLPHGHSEYNWYRCGDYDKIINPNGTLHNPRATRPEDRAALVA